MVTKEFLNKRRNYYEKKYVQYELLKAMKDREVVFLHRKENWKCSRGFWIKSIPYLEKAFDVVNFFNEDINIYISVAKYNYIPPFPYKLTERSNFTSQWFKDEAEKQQYDYDIFLDFDDKFRICTNKITRLDGRDINTYQWISNKPEMIKEILKIIKELPFPFYIIPSGQNYQIVMDNKKQWTKTKIIEYTNVLKKEFDLKYLDLSGIGHSFKIMKCPYSVVNEVVCLPLEDFHLEHLEEYWYYDINNVLKKEKIFKRGLKKKGVLKNEISL